MDWAWWYFRCLWGHRTPHFASYPTSLCTVEAPDCRVIQEVHKGKLRLLGQKPNRVSSVHWLATMLLLYALVTMYESTRVELEIYFRVMKTNWMHYLFSVYFVNQPLHVSGRICSPSSGGILYIYNNWYVLCFLVCWPTDSQLKSQHVPFVVYIQYTSWWWAIDMPEKCRGWLTN